MSKRGRPIKGTDKIESLQGSADAKHRLKIIMQSVSGELTIEEACNELGMEKSAFYRMREKALSGALSSLEPKEVGRPRTQQSEDQEYIEDLEAAMQVMRIELEASRIREELAISMPHVLKAQYEHLRENPEATLKEQIAKQKKKNKQARKDRKAQKKTE